jgi:pyruvate kinase
MRTKIIATLGPASMDYEVMKSLVHYGVRIFRLNFSHADPEYFEPTVANIRGLEKEFGIPLTIMGDLCGPKIRIGEVTGSPKSVEKGQNVLLGGPGDRDKSEGKPFIELEVPPLLKGLQPGSPVSLSDGMLNFRVSRVIEEDAYFELEAQNDGILTSYKGIAFPGKYHDLPALTDKDRRDLKGALKIGVDALAMSFVQKSDDVRDLKEEIKNAGKWVPVVAKLERQAAVDNLDSILEASDAIMVARGDLGLEAPLSSLPVIQKRIIRAARHHQKAAIVATQMLLSMVKNPVPTRAETTDVANAILDGADCVMLSEETAVGEYPVEAVKLISEIAEQAEDYFLERTQGPYPPSPKKNVVKYLAYSACLVAEQTDAMGIACHSTSGQTARLVSSRRPAHSIYALTPDNRVVRALNFTWNVRPRLADESVERHVERVEKFIQNDDNFKPGDVLIITSGQPTPGQPEISTNEIKIYTK